MFSFISQIVLNFIPILGGIYVLVLLLPSLSVTARRLHDIDRTAWWMLLYLVPILGFIVLAIMFIALLGLSAIDPWGAGEVEWGILGLLFLIWMIVSVVSVIVLLIFLILPGTEGQNRYGPDPLQQPVVASGLGGQDRPYSDATIAGDYGTSTFNSEPMYGSPSQGSASGRYCTQCGMQLQQEARFCTECGTPV